MPRALRTGVGEAVRGEVGLGDGEGDGREPVDLRQCASCRPGCSDRNSLTIWLNFRSRASLAPVGRSPTVASSLDWGVGVSIASFEGFIQGHGSIFYFWECMFLRNSRENCASGPEKAMQTQRKHILIFNAVPFRQIKPKGVRRYIASGIVGDF